MSSTQVMVSELTVIDQIANATQRNTHATLRHLPSAAVQIWIY
jgi:hypothetical protein